MLLDYVGKFINVDGWKYIGMKNLKLNTYLYVTLAI